MGFRLWAVSCMYLHPPALRTPRNSYSPASTIRQARGEQTVRTRGQVSEGMVEKGVRNDPRASKVELAGRFGHGVKVKWDQPVRSHGEHARGRQLKDPVVHHAGPGAQIGMKASAEGRGPLAGVGRLQADHQPLLGQ